MLNARCLPRTVPRIQKTPRAWRNFRNRAHNNNNNTRVAVSPYAYRRQQHFIRSIATVTTLGVIASAWQWYSGNRIFREAHAEEPPPEPELKFEKPRRKAVSKEDNRDLISSQHLQVKKSWENPGVYAWGSNSGRVAAPDSDEEFIKTPRRIPFFDGVLLRDLKLDRNFAAAINDKGDLLQWGTGYSKENRPPTHTLRGKNLTSLTISRDRIIALSAAGTVYSIPVSRAEQKTGPKPSNSWFPFWDASSSISYRTLTPHNLAWNERITTIAGGLEHVLLLTSKGRVFSAAAGSQDFPSKGQMGIPGLTWQTRPPGSYDQCHEIITLRGFEITSIAAGDYHSLVADREGRAFAFGDNSLGQLGFDCTPDSTFVDAPALLPIQKPYAGTSQVPRVTSVAAGGSTSFFTVDATEPASAASPGSTPRVSADALSCGQGIWGQLGTGRWTHVQATPTRIPALSGLAEYDEARKRTVPIRLARLSVGSSHAAAVLDNTTHVAASPRSSENDTNWGADVVFFGNNEFYQLGTGKRSNAAAPVYIRPLDAGAEREQGREGNRFQITPRKKVKVAGRSVEMEQRVECGRAVTAVYSGV
ncbi:RCC1/BLIP-II protein [Cenococcum geophilum 1.58]|uniref:RCC1/BLIP-II protein n=1 Tax=Cenococcum geophilum 1.58 TaxID=794803 RepID=UPI0035902873|nr:RCC1/BLIP-II protein [Cenococcum geophilum 1.58]